MITSSTHEECPGLQSILLSIIHVLSVEMDNASEHALLAKFRRLNMLAWILFYISVQHQPAI